MRRRGQRGAALVEMAIAIPVLLLVVFGVIEFGIYVNRNINLTQGVREAGRQGAVANYAGGNATCAASGSPTNQLVCLTKVRIGVTGAAVHVIGPSTNAVGSAFAVCATYKTQSITGIMQAFLPRYIHTETIMRIEQAPSTGLTTGGDTDPEGNGWSSCTTPS